MEAMKALWKDTFHDSDQYINLVFQQCYHPDFAEIEVRNGKVVAALMGVPYRFGNTENSLPALYLCGLATLPEYRSQGIMSELLDRINDRAKDAGFAFTFLVPANIGLRKYYRDRGYVNAFYRVADNYTNLHDFNREYESLLFDQKEKVAELKRKYFASLRSEIFDSSSPDAPEILQKMIAMMHLIEDSQQDFRIIHSDQQWRTIFDENSISGGTICYTHNADGDITAVVFCERSSRGEAVKISHIAYLDEASIYRALDGVKREFPDVGICRFISSVEMDRKAVWSRSYGSFLGEAPQAPSLSATERVYSLAAHAKVYGMAKILNLHEILKFQAEGRRDLKYSILTKTGDPQIVEQIEVKAGKMKVSTMPIENLSPSQSAHLMTRRDISEILFRRRDTDNLITEAFGIPSINGAIYLMLD